MSDNKDFVIENGVLKKYVGTDAEVMIPDGVKKIGAWAFDECANLTTVIIPDSVTGIDYKAFNECVNLISVTIPDSVTEFGLEVFNGCEGLKNADGFISVGNILFEYKGDAAVVTIPDNVTVIGDSAFEGCRSLTSVTIPKGITEIGCGAFLKCANLTSVTIAYGVKKIGAWAFEGCRSLTSVTIPDSVTEIGYKAFNGCVNLASVTIPDSVTEIDLEAFSGCTNLNVLMLGSPTFAKNRFAGVLSIIAPKMSVAKFTDIADKYVATRAFLSNMPLYTDLTIVEDYKKYALSQRKKLLPDILKEDNVEALAFYADNKKITVKNFDEEYFIPAEESKAQNCIAFLLDWKNKNITAEDIEKKIKKEFTKDPYNVADMKKLWSYEVMEDGSICITGYKGKDSEVYVPERIGKRMITSIGGRAFCIINTSGNYKPKATRDILQKITAIYIPDSVTAIGGDAFYRCENLASVNIPDRVTEIGGGAFSGCKNLTSVTIPDGVTTIEPHAFNKCASLTSVTIPDNVKKIGYWAFGGCRSLTSVTIPDSVTKIGECAFHGCVNLASVNIPDSVTEIGGWVFSGCANITIHAPAGSYAEKYARENNIPFVAEG